MAPEEACCGTIHKDDAIAENLFYQWAYVLFRRVSRNREKLCEQTSLHLTAMPMFHPVRSKIDAMVGFLLQWSASWVQLRGYLIEK
jgi:hypothetical protein